MCGSQLALVIPNPYMSVEQIKWNACVKNVLYVARDEQTFKSFRLVVHIVHKKAIRK